MRLEEAPEGTKKEGNMFLKQRLHSGTGPSLTNVPECPQTHGKRAETQAMRWGWETVRKPMLLGADRREIPAEGGGARDRGGRTAVSRLGESGTLGHHSRRPAGGSVRRDLERSGGLPLGLWAQREGSAGMRTA